MKTLINQSRFIKAVEYASRHHFSKPFSISPMVGRWFNQLSMIELENGKLLHLSGALARECVDITLDGQIVDKKDIGLIFRFCAQDSQQEQERAAINESMTKLEKELEGLPDNDENKAKYAELAAITAQLQSFDRDKARANELYLNIVSRGTSSLNQQRIEEKYHSKIKNIIHRPNHGLTHSVRVAYMTTAIHAFKQRYGLECSLL